MHSPTEPPTQDLGQAPQTAPPGWYPEPTTGAGLRWWDGSAWTEHVSETQGREAPAKTSGFATAALVFGIIGGLFGIIGGLFGIIGGLFGIVFGFFGIVFGFVARGRIKRSGGELGGRGLATAGIVLGFLWVAIYAAVVTLAVTGVFDDEPNAVRFSGEEREVAATVDRFQSASDDERFDEICNDIFTPRFTRLLEQGADTSCVDYYEEELGGRYQVPIQIEELEIDESTATVQADEGGTPVEIRLVDDSGEWRIENLIER